MLGDDHRMNTALLLDPDLRLLYLLENSRGSILLVLEDLKLSMLSRLLVIMVSNNIGYYGSVNEDAVWKIEPASRKSRRNCVMYVFLGYQTINL